MKKRQNKDFDAVSFMRQQRNKISKKLFNMSGEEILNHFQKIRTENKLRIQDSSHPGL